MLNSLANFILTGPQEGRHCYYPHDKSDEAESWEVKRRASQVDLQMPRSWAAPQTVCLQGLCPSPLYNAISQIFNKNYLLALSSQLKEVSNNSPFYKPCSSLILTGPSSLLPSLLFLYKHEILLYFQMDSFDYSFGLKV